MISKKHILSNFISFKRRGTVSLNFLKYFRASANHKHIKCIERKFISRIATTTTTKEKKQKKRANDLNDSECQNEIFRRAKQMVKERQDITGLNCIKGASGKVIVDDKRIKDCWKEYMEKLMNEENEWDHKISAEVKEGPAAFWPG